MAHLIIQYPSSPHKNRVVFSGKLDDLIFHLDTLEAKIKKEQISKCGTVFTEIARMSATTLNTCIYKNIGTEEEESIDKNYLIV